MDCLPHPAMIPSVQLVSFYVFFATQLFQYIPSYTTSVAVKAAIDL